LNQEGWIMTVAHLWQPHHTALAHKTEIANYKQELKKIDEDENLTPAEKDAKKAVLNVNPKWITNTSFWWGQDGLGLQDVRPLPEADLILGRLDPFDASSITNYPVLKDPGKNISPGTSLCRTGFPFHTIKTDFDPKRNSFSLDAACLPPPFFPIEGIFTRNVVVGKSKDNHHEIKFLETSSPGLKGQSGGPIFDCHGTIWGLQSRTKNLPLGFSPKVKRGDTEVEENQFLNVGEGIHVETILSFIKANRISVQVSEC